MKILIIDDSNSARYLAVKMVRDIGYNDIVGVESAEEALVKIKTENFDCILLDWNLGGMSGMDFLQKFRASPEHDKTAVIMVTTVNEKKNVLQALKVGVQGYFFKPVNAATLGPKLKEIEAKHFPDRQKDVTQPPSQQVPAAENGVAKEAEQAPVPTSTLPSGKTAA
jgi:CheY-like chemotaxis protein